MKASSSRAKARTNPPASEKPEVPAGPPRDEIRVTSGPNTSGHADQVASVHVDEEGVAPIDATTEVGADDEET